MGIIPARAGFTRQRKRRRPAKPDHPRSRGVYLGCFLPAPEHQGSSPLARGFPIDTSDGTVSIRIIPARAGFTDTVASSGFAGEDHPRSRGVYSECSFHHCAEEGSSPLARGLLGADRDAGGEAGIIPARAGFTCAETRISLSRSGSSPLARGLRESNLEGVLAEGIIPARAGFTRRPASPPHSAPDHPRSRGVYDPGPGVCRRGVGSSPLARGLHMVKRNGERDWGIIPARAGFTGTRPGRTASAGDHPRSRGVYLSRWLAGTRTVGSSPLARGLQTSLTCGRLPVRIIPARAGFTSRTPCSSRPRRDHPRSRGVYSSNSCTRLVNAGSSPLAWGLRHH